MSPGYLIGGVPGNFTESARLGESDFFVIEADEYDTSFFDKRSKFVHYQPNTLVLNNLEYDHADIFADLAAIQTQVHHVVRTVPQSGLVLYRNEASLQTVIDQGCWSEQQTLSPESGAHDANEWSYDLLAQDGSHFTVYFRGEKQAEVQWPLTGEHNVQNGMSAIAAARHIGVVPSMACEALEAFKGVKRRMELIGEVEEVKVYDDFAHHPTAIATTLEGLRAKVGDDSIVVVIEPRSNTMKQGIHQEALLEAVKQADVALWYQPEGLTWDLSSQVALTDKNVGGSIKLSKVEHRIESLIEKTLYLAAPNSHIVIMSNGGFESFHRRLIDALEVRKSGAENVPNLEGT